MSQDLLARIVVHNGRDVSSSDGKIMRPLCQRPHPYMLIYSRTCIRRSPSVNGWITAKYRFPIKRDNLVSRLQNAIWSLYLQFIQKLAQKCVESRSSLINTENNKMEAQRKNRPIKQNSAVYYYLTVGPLTSKRLACCLCVTMVMFVLRRKIIWNHCFLKSSRWLRLTHRSIPIMASVWTDR